MAGCSDKSLHDGQPAVSTQTRLFRSIGEWEHRAIDSEDTRGLCYLIKANFNKQSGIQILLDEI